MSVIAIASFAANATTASIGALAATLADAWSIRGLQPKNAWHTASEARWILNPPPGSGVGTNVVSPIATHQAATAAMRAIALGKTVPASEERDIASKAPGAVTKANKDTACSTAH